MTKLLILDLDETLVFSTTTPLGRPPDVVVGEYLVYRRPGLEAFLQTVSKQFTLAVWTSPGYGRMVHGGPLRIVMASATT